MRMKNTEYQWHRMWPRVGPRQWVGLAMPLVFLSRMLLFSRSVVSNSVTPWTDCSLPGSSVHGIPQEKNTGAGCHFLLQGTFLTQGFCIVGRFSTTEPPGKPFCLAEVHKCSLHCFGPGLMGQRVSSLPSRSSHSDRGDKQGN